MVVAFLSTPARDQRPPQVGSVSPAAPYRTVRAVLPHTALRHRSSSGMRRAPSSDVSGEPIDAEPGEPAVVEPAGREAIARGVLDAGQLGHPLVHVAVDGGELPVRVAVSEVSPPAPQHGVQVTENLVQVAAGEAAVGVFADLG